jgi:hypothetical protein
MIDPTLLTGNVLSPSAASTSSLAPTVLTSDVDRFRAAMMASPGAASGTAPAGFEAAGLPPPSSGAPTLGDTILSGMKSVSEDTRQRYQVAAELLEKPNPSVSDLMTLQYSLLQSSLQFEMVSKGISTTTRNLDSILKTQ